MTNRPTTTVTIRLRPVDRYFFGGEAHYEGSLTRQYFHRSNPYPQQTALLGMLRHQLLIQEGLIPLNNGNHDPAAQLIGEAGFNAGNTQGYGIIQSITPLRWLHGGKVHDIRPFDWLEVDGQPQRPSIEWGNHAETIRGMTMQVPIFRYKEMNKKTNQLEGKPWIAKTHFATMLAHDTTGGHKMCSVVEDIEQVGIHKDREGKAKEEGYFKFVYQRLAADWSFVFQVTFFKETEEGKSIAFDTSKRIIIMGAERSAFELEMLTTGPILPASLTAADGALQRMLLTSDAYIDDEATIYNLCELPLCAATPFKHITSTVRRVGYNYASLPNRSGQYHLLRRGSVFYTKQAKSLANELEKQTAFRNIGYNHFIIENP